MNVNNRIMKNHLIIKHTKFHHRHSLWSFVHCSPLAICLSCASSWFYRTQFKTVTFPLSPHNISFMFCSVGSFLLFTLKIRIACYTLSATSAISSGGTGHILNVTSAVCATFATSSEGTGYTLSATGAISAISEGADTTLSTICATGSTSSGGAECTPSATDATSAACGAPAPLCATLWRLRHFLWRAPDPSQRNHSGLVMTS